MVKEKIPYQIFSNYEQSSHESKKFRALSEIFNPTRSVEKRVKEYLLRLEAVKESPNYPLHQVNWYMVWGAYVQPSRHQRLTFAHPVVRGRFIDVIGMAVQQGEFYPYLKMAYSAGHLAGGVIVELNSMEIPVKKTLDRLIGL